MKKIILPVIILLILLLLGLGYLVIFKSNPDPQTTSQNTYKISFAVNAEGFKDVFLNDSKNLLPAKDIEQYITFFINSPGDLIWITCNENYKLKSYFSPTGENIIFDPSLGAGLVLEKNSYKTMGITCEKYE